MQRYGARTRNIVLLLTLLLMCIFGTYYIYRQSMQSSNRAYINFDKEVPVVGTMENFNKIVNEYSNIKGDLAVYNGVNNQTASNPIASAVGNSVSGIQSENRYLTANTKINGADEPDTIKSYGEYIYQVDEQNINIIKAYPADTLNIEGVVRFEDGTFSPLGIYVDKNRLLVIGTAYKKNAASYQGNGKQSSKPNTPSQYSITSLLVYDIKDKTKPKIEREIEIEGNYISSIKTGSNIYFVTSRPVDYSVVNNGIEDLPTFKDSAAGDSKIKIGYDEIRYFPGSIQANYINIVSFNIEKPNNKANICTYLGAGQNIYLSRNNIYITVTEYSKQKPVNIDKSKEEDIGSSKSMGLNSYETATYIYKFNLKDDKVKFSAKGQVPGISLNQYSMDENNGFFRIATISTTHNENGKETSRSNLYILNEKLKIQGKIENLAPEENIYSVEFIGDRAFAATFDTNNSLFVIDLKKPKYPKVVGTLKIPGYSDLLQPYDENHIIGFGKNTLETGDDANGGSGEKNSGNSFGMKISMFDVSNIKKPVEMFSTRIGYSGTDSIILRDYNALFFDKKRNFLAFPVELMEINKNNNTNSSDISSREPGIFTFQGAYLYNVSLSKGFSLKGKITHITQEEYKEPGHKWYDGNKFVNRILYINNTLYTISNKTIEASNIDDLKEIKAISIN